jgi:hypothetical protein
MTPIKCFYQHFIRESIDKKQEYIISLIDSMRKNTKKNILFVWKKKTMRYRAFPGKISVQNSGITTVAVP